MVRLPVHARRSELCSFALMEASVINSRKSYERVVNQHLTVEIICVEKVENKKISETVAKKDVKCESDTTHFEQLVQNSYFLGCGYAVWFRGHVQGRAPCGVPPAKRSCFWPRRISSPSRRSALNIGCAIRDLTGFWERYSGKRFLDSG